MLACFLALGNRALALPDDAAEGEPVQAEAPAQDEAPARELDIFWEWQDEQEVRLLPGWGYEIRGGDNAYSVHVGDGDTWQVYSYTVTDVELSANGDNAIELHQPEQDQDSWHIDARGFGTATLDVTYAKPAELGGGQGSYTLTINVTDEVYRLEAWSKDGSYQTLPGTSRDFMAMGWIETYDPETGEYGRQEEGLSFVWSFEDAHSAELATLDDHGETATVNVLPQSNNDMVDDGVFLRVAMLREGVELAATQTRLMVRNPYTEIEPTVIDSDLEVGASLVIEPHLVGYELDELGNPQEGTVPEALPWKWRDYDPESIAITDNNNGTFTLTRIAPHDINFSLAGFFANPEGNILEVEANYHLNDRDYNLWLERDEDRVYSDGELELRLRTDGPLPEAATVTYTIGVWDNDDWTAVFDEVTLQSSAFSELNGFETAFTLDGGELWTWLEAYDRSDVRICAEVRLGDIMLAECDDWIDVREARVEYEQREDRAMLPGWWDDIDQWGRVWMDTADRPDSEDQYEVLDVTVAHQEIGEGNRTGSVVTVRRDDDGGENHWWHIDAQGYGQALLTVSYRDLDGEEQAYQYTITVAADVYNLDVWTEGSDRALPGQSVTLRAEGHHETDYDFDESEEAFVYEWTLDEWAQQWATIEPDPNDPQKATVTFIEMPDDWDEMHADIEATVRLKVRDQAGQIVCDDEGEPIVFAERRQHLRVESDYYEIWPVQLGRGFDVGESVTYDFQLRHYALDSTGDAGFETVPVTDWEWSYDENCVAVTGEGNRFTITRLREWGTDVGLRALFEAPWGEDDAYQNYWLDECNYDVRLEADRYVVYSDGTLDVYLEGGDFAGLGFDVTYELYGWGEGITDFPIDEATGAFQVQDGYITLNGAKLVELGLSNVNVNVCVTYGDWEVGRSERTIDVREAYEDYEQRWGREMIPGWWFDIDPRYMVNVGNAEYPDGLDDSWYDISSVVVTQQDPRDGNTGDVVRVTEKPEEEGGGWRVTGVGYGHATVDVSYLDIRGETKWWEPLEVVVQPDVYGMFLEPEDGGERFFPGSTVAVRAEGWHVAEDDSIPTDDEYLFEWELRGDDYWATGEVDPADDSRYLVTFRDLDDPREGIWCDYDVEAIMYLKDPSTGGKALDDEGEPIELHRHSCHLVLAAQFSELHPLLVDANAPTSIPFEVTPELRWYDYSYTGETDPADRYDVVENVTYTWDFDPSQMSVEDNGDGTVSITRLSPADIDFTLVATREDGARFEQHLWFDDLGYDYDLSTATVTGVVDKVFNGQPQTQDGLVVTMETAEGTQTLAEGADYVVRYYRNVDPTDEAIVLIKAAWMADEDDSAYLPAGAAERHTYGGRKLLTFKIKASLDQATIAPIGPLNFTGKALTPKPVVTLDGETLQEGTDYTLSYSNNTKAGTATVTVTGKGDYAGTSKSATFQIREVWVRRAGQNALDTMKAIGGEFGKASVAVVTTNADFKDALAASALAGQNEALVLTTPKGSAAAQTKEALKAAGVKTVYVVGSTADVSNAAMNGLKSGTGVKTVKRVAAKSGASTKAIELAKLCTKHGDTVIIATQASFKDALSIAPYSYATKSPILYAETSKKLSSATLSYIKGQKFKKAIIVGGPVALPASIDTQLKGAGVTSVTRLAGGDSYTTSEVIARWATGQYKNGQNVGTYQDKPLAYVKFQPGVLMSVNKLAVAQGQSWKDALCGAALVGKNKSVLLLADDKSGNHYAKAVAVCTWGKASITRAYVLGGTSAVSAKVWEALLASTAL